MHYSEIFSHWDLMAEGLYSSDRGVWREPIILLASLIMRGSFVLRFVVRPLYQDEMLKYKFEPRPVKLGQRVLADIKR